MAITSTSTTTNRAYRHSARVLSAGAQYSPSLLHRLVRDLVIHVTPPTESYGRLDEAMR